MEDFMKRLKENDKVLVKATIQNKTKECYFLGRVINKRTELDSPIVAIQLEGEDGIRGIKLKDIGSIERVKKTIIPMDFIFKDENIKAKKLGIRGEYDCEADKNCDGKLDEGESTMTEAEIDAEMDQMSPETANLMNQPKVKTSEETIIGGVKGNEAPKQVIVDEGDLEVQDFISDDESEFKDLEDDQTIGDDQTIKRGGKKKKKKNRSRSKKNKKKRKRKNSTKKKN